MTIRAYAIQVGSIYLVHPRSSVFCKWSKPPNWMRWLLYFPGAKSGFIDNNGQFLNIEEAHLSAFCSGQLEEGSSAAGELTWDQLRF